ncbi:carbohydrate ABC transporter permease [Streptomyces sp. NPDC007251]|uniref:carbohydrate ABC transporter permease n=1 Tax=Streptomyces sp. NPDC007251 TaxID=3154483 RepID=UPI0033E650FB
MLQAFQSEQTLTAPPNSASLTHLTWRNFRGIFSASVGLWHFVLNSLLVAGGTALLVTLIAALGGYGFARYRFRGSNAVLGVGVVLVSMMVPFQAILTPLFLELNAMGLTDSRFGLVLFSTTMNLPFGVFVMRNAFLTSPHEIEESAKVDGASVPQLLVRVLRPLVLSGMLTVLLYAFLATWTDFLGALTFLTKSDLVTLPVELSNLQQGVHGQVDFGYLAAGAVVSMIPCIVLYVSLQKYYVRGLTAGALKA